MISTLGRQYAELADVPQETIFRQSHCSRAAARAATVFVNLVNTGVCGTRDVQRGSAVEVVRWMGIHVGKEGVRIEERWPHRLTPLQCQDKIPPLPI